MDTDMLLGLASDFQREGAKQQRRKGKDEGPLAKDGDDTYPPYPPVKPNAVVHAPRFYRVILHFSPVQNPY